MEQVTAYRTRDGKIFEYEEGALTHEAELRLADWVDDCGLGRGGEWSEEMILRAIREEASNLLALLWDLASPGARFDLENEIRRRRGEEMR